MQMQTADWYFDFISPYAYFGLLRLTELSNDLEIRYRPVLFAALLDHWGQKGSLHGLRRNVNHNSTR
jgi:2-hydroxychromene-2-carboxylate isomerase